MKYLLTVSFPQIYLKISNALFISEVGCWSWIATQVNVAFCGPGHLAQSVREKANLTTW